MRNTPESVFSAVTSALIRAGFLVYNRPGQRWDGRYLGDFTVTSQDYPAHEGVRVYVGAGNSGAQVTVEAIDVWPRDVFDAPVDVERVGAVIERRVREESERWRRASEDFVAR